MIDDSTYIFFSTALSQQPCLIYEEAGGKILFRPRDFTRFLDFAGVKKPYRVSPVMAEQFYLYFESEAEAEAGERRLRGLRVEGKPLMILNRDGASLFGGCVINQTLPKEAAITNLDAQAAPFFDLLYQIEGVKSGMHHPDGMLWVRTPSKEHRTHPERVELTSIAPTMLSLFRVASPPHMKGDPLPDIAPAERSPTAAASRLA
jgi:hypothetical protein